jgi:hypothetical protein
VTLVIVGLDPAIHPLEKATAKIDGYAGPVYAKASTGFSLLGRHAITLLKTPG